MRIMRPYRQRSMAGCSSSGHAGSASVQTGPAEKLPEQDVLCAIRIIAGDTVLDGVLYDNPTAQEFAEKLPITTETWHAAPGFARAFDLPEQIEQKGTPGYGGARCADWKNHVGYFRF